MVYHCKYDWPTNEVGFFVEANLTNTFSAGSTGNATSNSTSNSTSESNLPHFPNATIPTPWSCDSSSYPSAFSEGTYRNQMIVVGDTRLPPRNATIATATNTTATNATATNATAVLDPAFLPNKAQVNLVSLCPTL